MATYHSNYGHRKNFRPVYRPYNQRPHYVNYNASAGRKPYWKPHVSGDVDRQRNYKNNSSKRYDTQHYWDTGAKNSEKKKLDGPQKIVSTNARTNGNKSPPTATSGIIYAGTHKIGKSLELSANNVSEATEVRCESLAFTNVVDDKDNFLPLTGLDNDRNGCPPTVTPLSASPYYNHRYISLLTSNRVVESPKVVAIPDLMDVVVTLPPVNEEEVKEEYVEGRDRTQEEEEYVFNDIGSNPTNTPVARPAFFFLNSNGVTPTIPQNSVNNHSNFSSASMHPSLVPILPRDEGVLPENNSMNFTFNSPSNMHPRPVPTLPRDERALPQNNSMNLKSILNSLTTFLATSNNTEEDRRSLREGLRGLLWGESEKNDLVEDSTAKRLDLLESRLADVEVHCGLRNNGSHVRVVPTTPLFVSTEVPSPSRSFSTSPSLSKTRKECLGKNGGTESAAESSAESNAPSSSRSRASSIANGEVPTLDDNRAYPSQPLENRSFELSNDLLLCEETSNEKKLQPGTVDIPLTFIVDIDEFVVVHTDGTCVNKEKPPRGGLGVWFGDEHPLNISMPITSHRITNNSAEIQAARVAIETAINAGIARLRINTDSQFLKKCTSWMRAWKDNGWKKSDGRDVKNKTELKKLIRILSSSITVDWNYVSAQCGAHGNEMAQMLADAGAASAVFVKQEPMDA